MADKKYLEYLSTLNQPKGWFELVIAMTSLMAENTHHNEDLAFLQVAGKRIATMSPLPKVEYLTDLQRVINNRLDEYHWGCVDISDEDTYISIYHHCMPSTEELSKSDRWLHAFSAILLGLYSEWFKQTGTDGRLRLVIDKIVAPSDVIFMLKKA